jgi:hypothetical protein
LPMVTGRFIENVTFFDDLAWFGHDLGIFWQSTPPVDVLGCPIEPLFRFFYKKWLYRAPLDAYQGHLALKTQKVTDLMTFGWSQNQKSDTHFFI